MLEIAIENRLKTAVKRLGGMALKTDVIPGQRGFPDRTILLPGGRIYFIELKKKGEKPRKQQRIVINWLKRLGFTVLVIDDYESVDQFILEVS